MGRFVRALLAHGIVVAIAGCSSMSRSDRQKNHSNDTGSSGSTAVGGDMFPLSPCDRSGDEHSR